MRVRSSNAQVVTQLVVGPVAFEGAVELFGLSARQRWRLRACFLTEGPAALMHS